MSKLVPYIIYCEVCVNEHECACVFMIGHMVFKHMYRNGGNESNLERLVLHLLFQVQIVDFNILIYVCISGCTQMCK